MYRNVLEFVSGAECALKTWLETFLERDSQVPYMASRTIMAHHE
jgi:hypothetical protein